MLAGGLDAVLVVPAGARAAVLICHGIGETVEHWPRAQALLAKQGIASLIFNYTGFGRSRGRISPGQCEADAVAAFGFLRERVAGVPVTLLGFSLGTGMAAALVGRVPAESLVMCEEYTSFREAACRMGVPRFLRYSVRDVWRSEAVLRPSSVPVLVVHGGAGRLFPVRMGRALAEASGGRLVVVDGMGHSDLHARPTAENWGPIVEWVRSRSGGRSEGVARAGTKLKTFSTCSPRS